MKIIILCLSEGIGGLELYSLREYQALLTKGVECVPVVTEGSLLDERFRKAGIQPRYLKVKLRKFPFIAAKKLARIVEEEQATLIHMHWAKDLHLATLAKKQSGGAFKLVYTRHMGITRSKQDVMHQFLYQELDALWVITNQMKREALERLPIKADKVDRLYLGVKAPDVKGQSNECFFEQTNFPRRTLNIALFGRIEHGKGQHLLIAALGELKNQQIDVSATFVGHVMDQGYKQQLLVQIEALGIQNRTQFVGFLENPINIMSSFDVVVLATFNETFGLVLPEAMRAGVAVIGTDAGGVPEIIDDGETGLLVEPGNHQSLADAIARIYEDSALRQRLVRKGKEKADRMFSEENHFEAVVGLLNKYS